MLKINRNKDFVKTGGNVGSGMTITPNINQSSSKRINDKSIQMVDDNGNHEPVNPTKLYQDAVNKGSTNIPTKDSIVSSVNGNSIENPKSAIDVYKAEASKLQGDKDALNKNDEHYDIEKDALNSKIESTNALLASYMKNAEATQSAKVASQTAQQNAINSTQAYMKAIGLGNQGIAESTMANMGNNYANAIAGIHASENANNANAQASYIEALKQADAERQSRIDAKEEIKSAREYEQKQIEDAKLENEKIDTYNYVNEGLQNSINTVDGSIDGNEIVKYGNLIEEYKNQGKLNDLDYKKLLDTYNYLAEQHKYAYGSEVGESTGAIAYNNKELNVSNEALIRSWLQSTFDFNKYSDNFEQAVREITNAGNGQEVTIHTKGTNTKVVIRNGKVYMVKQGKTKN